jgi:hypothetical protein
MTQQHEHIAQRQVVAWAQAQSGLLPELQLLYAIPNGGHRMKAVAGKLKAEGVKAGVPDLCLPVARGGYHGLYIEMKAGANRATKPQKTWITALSRQGYRALVCHGFEDARGTIIDYLGAGSRRLVEAA